MERFRFCKLSKELHKYNFTFKFIDDTYSDSRIDYDDIRILHCNWVCIGIHS